MTERPAYPHYRKTCTVMPIAWGSA